jgi:hypothetical protein
MALGMIFIALALSLAILENFVTAGKRTREEETIWRGEQYQRAVRLYYHKMGRYPQTIDDLKKGGLNLHFLRQEYKNPMNKTDGTWRFIYVNAAGQIIGSTRYNNLQQMVLIDQYAGLIPGAATPGSVTPGQGMGVSAASLASTSGVAGFGGSGAVGGLSGASLQQQQQLQSVLAGILNPGDTTTPDQANNGTQLPPLDSSQNGTSQAGNSSGSSGTSQSDTSQTDTSQSGAPPQLPSNLAGQLPPGVTQDQVNQFLQNGQLPAGITPDQVAQYVQGIQLPPGVTQDQITQYIQNLQQGGGSSPNPQNPTQQNGQTGFGVTPGQNGQSALGLSAGQLGLGSSSQSAPALSPLLALKPTGPVDSPVLGAFFTGVACTTDVKGVKYYRRAKKYKDWEFIWNPLEDALAAAQQPGGGQQGGVLPGQSSAASGLGGSSSLSNSFGSSSGISIGSGTTVSGSIGSSPQQPQQQQPQ